MNTLLGTIVVMLVTTALIFGVPMLFQSDMETRTIALDYRPMLPEGDEVTTAPMEPAPSPWRGLAEKFLDHIQELFWALVQAFLVARYVKKRG